jgi:histidinol-phosphate phosphatase family protein
VTASAPNHRRAVFLDKDGTLVEDVPYNVDPSKVQLTPGAAAGLAALRRADYRLIVVSNQSGAARGYFAPSALEGVRERLSALLAAQGVQLDGFYWCPHHPQGDVPELSVVCDCRKPAAGLLLRAAAELGINLETSWLIGDILDDVEAGRRAGCRTILLDNGHETLWRLTPNREPDHLVTELEEAARLILAQDGGES